MMEYGRTRRRPGPAGDHRRSRRRRAPPGHDRVVHVAAGDRRAGAARALRRHRLAAVDRADARGHPGGDRRNRQRPQRGPARGAHPRDERPDVTCRARPLPRRPRRRSCARRTRKLRRARARPATRSRWRAGCRARAARRAGHHAAIVPTIAPRTTRTRSWTGGQPELVDALVLERLHERPAEEHADDQARARCRAAR